MPTFDNVHGTGGGSRSGGTTGQITNQTLQENFRNPAPLSQANLVSSSAKDISSGSGGDLWSALDADRSYALASARETNAFNAAEAEKSRQWQEYMSNTSHQREVKDLIAAGLNPILSANNGATAYTAASASGVKADTPSGANAIANIMAAAMTSSAMVSVAQINAASSLAVSKNNNNNSMYGTLNKYLGNVFESLGNTASSGYSHMAYKLKQLTK